jgi:hypothetical protein
MEGPPAVAELPLELQPSHRSYATAVILSAVFGFIGIQHFYLRRWAEAFVDVGLSISWIVCGIRGEWIWAGLFMLLDFGHSFGVTILLLTGNFRDGDGRIVCYPGQKLKAGRRG